MYCMHNADSVVRSHRKYLLNTGSLFLILSLLLTQIACRPSDDEGDSNTALDGVDNVEFHHVKVIDGVMHEDHPVIMYKEDFVNEHHKPYGRRAGKKYKDISGHRQREQQNKTVAAEENQSEKSEKIYFDVLPTAPVVNDDDENFDLSQIKVEHLPLELKETKRPKKYHHRVRRQADTEEHHVHKRNPYFRHVYHYPINYVAPIAPQPQQTYVTVFQRHPVKGQRQPSISIGSRIGDGPIRYPTDDENVDREVFPPAPVSSTRRPSIWHDSNPENADFSAFDEVEKSSNDINTVFGPTPTEGKSNNDIIFYPKAAEIKVSENCELAIKYCCAINDFNGIYNCFYIRNCPSSTPDILNYCY